jgi:hypothetical protein
MLTVLFIGDGPRDAATVPRLVERLLGVTVKERIRHWRELRVGGYRRKLLFAAREARDAGAAGVVACVDTDKDDRGEKRRELRLGRDDDRSRYPDYPIALGEAKPHGEAWLLADAVAVRQALGLGLDVHIPTVRQTKSPKETWEELRLQGDRAEDNICDVLAAIARLVDPSRCPHARVTGLQELQAEVRRELGPPAGRCGEGCRCGDACAPEAHP